MTNANAITLAPDREPWVRQPRETEKASVAFQQFLVQTPPRSIARLAREHGKHLQALYDWSSRYHWNERAAQYDAWVARSHDVELAEARKEMNERHAKLAKAMSAKVAARIQRLDPDELSPGELGRWMQVLSMVERLALGEGPAAPSVEVNVTTNVDAKHQEVVFDRGYVHEVLSRLADVGIDLDQGPGSTADVVDVTPPDDVRPDDA